MNDLYKRRNYLLHRATSYRGKDWNDTKRVRVWCFIEADSLTQQLEEQWANQMKAPPVNYNLYDHDGNITHMMLTSDGITHKYVKISNWLAEDVKIKRLDPVEKFRYHELSVSEEELKFKNDIKRMVKMLGV